MSVNKLLTVLLGVLMPVLLLHAIVLAANQCCHSQPGCGGCVQILPDRFVNVGQNFILTCTPTQQSSSCDEQTLDCFRLTNAQLFSQEGCSNPVGTATVSFGVPQCTDSDDACGNG